MESTDKLFDAFPLKGYEVAYSFYLSIKHAIPGTEMY